MLNWYNDSFRKLYILYIHTLPSVKVEVHLEHLKFELRFPQFANQNYAFSVVVWALQQMNVLSKRGNFNKFHFNDFEALKQVTPTDHQCNLKVFNLKIHTQIKDFSNPE